MKVLRRLLILTPSRVMPAYKSMAKWRVYALVCEVPQTEHFKDGSVFGVATHLRGDRRLRC